MPLRTNIKYHILLVSAFITRSQIHGKQVKKKHIGKQWCKESHQALRIYALFNKLTDRPKTRIFIHFQQDICEPVLTSNASPLMRIYYSCVNTLY
jgi:hypothetical protein